MHKWLNARCAKLLEDLNNTPFTDDVDDLKLNLIRSAMREASLEMFNRAAENSRKKIEQISRDSLAETIEGVASSMDDEKTSKPTESHSPLNSAFISAAPAKKDDSAAVQSTEEKAQQSAEVEKPKPKIQISSSLIRRSD